MHKTFKYLGIEIDQDLKFSKEIQNRKDKLKELEKKNWIIQSKRLSDTSRIEAWNCLFKSKISYASEVLCYKSKALVKWLKSFHYNSLRKLLCIRSSVDQEKLFKRSYGSSWECWYDQKLQATRGKLGMKPRSPLCNCERHSLEVTKDSTPLKTLSRMDGLYLIKWQMGCFLSGMKRVKGTQNQMISVKNYCKCP